ncbi:MAG: hypothetical protein ACETWM_17490, partial [Candidatus Lokiarchaeia archaeon]
YVDSVVTINGGMLEANYTNTTEIQNTAFTNRILRYISFYGSSHITINNTNMSSTNLYVYGSSQVTLINSTFASIETYESAEITINYTTNATIDGVIELYDESSAHINNSNITTYGMDFHDESRVYASESQLLLASYDPYNYYNGLFDNSYLNASNCTIDVLKAFDFSTGQITNSSTVDEFRSYDAADFSVDNSTVPVIEYGLVCTVGSLTINGSNPAVGLGNCRNTTTLTNGNYDPTPSLVSVGALASSSVNITNNNTITRVFAKGSSQVYLENNTGLKDLICTDYSTTVFKNTEVNFACWFKCWDYSNLTLDNITTLGNMLLDLYDQSNLTFRNTILPNVPLSIGVYNQSTLHVENIETTRHLWIYSYDSSVVHVENVTMSGSFPPALEIGSYDSSVVVVVNVTIVSPASSEFYGYDLSTMTINSSNITSVGYGVKSAGDFSVTGGVPSGAYTNTTTWNDPKSLGTVTLSSIAVVGTDAVTITDSNLDANLYLHDNASLNIQNSTISERVYVYDSSTVSGTNTTFEYVYIYDQSSASLSNTTFQYSIYIYDQSGASLSNVTVSSWVRVYDSAALTCTGTPAAPSTIYRVYAESNYPDMANVQINNCTVTDVHGATWITLQAPALGYIPLLLLLNYYFYSSSQSQQFTFTLLVLGGVVAAIVAAAAVILWRRRA